MFNKYVVACFGIYLISDLLFCVFFLDWFFVLFFVFFVVCYSVFVGFLFIKNHENGISLV